MGWGVLGGDLGQEGAMRGAFSTIDRDAMNLIAKAKASPSMVGLDLASRVTTPTGYEWSEPSRDFQGGVKGVAHQQLTPSRFHVAAYDYGIKHNILRRLVDIGCRVSVLPATTSATDCLRLKPDGVFLSNGPGDPEPLEYAAKAVRELMGRVPIFGICLGHQVIGLALGGKTYKLKFGHRGANHPVLNKLTNKVEITSQNHGFAVDPDSVASGDVDLTHWNLNDDTLEGLRHRKDPLFCVQYHPEAAPGPHDSQYLFTEFVCMMRKFH